MVCHLSWLLQLLQLWNYLCRQEHALNRFLNKEEMEKISQKALQDEWLWRGEQDYLANALSTSLHHMPTSHPAPIKPCTANTNTTAPHIIHHTQYILRPAQHYHTTCICHHYPVRPSTTSHVCTFHIVFTWSLHHKSPCACSVCIFCWPPYCYATHMHIMPILHSTIDTVYSLIIRTRKQVIIV